MNHEGKPNSIHLKSMCGNFGVFFHVSTVEQIYFSTNIVGLIPAQK